MNEYIEFDSKITEKDLFDFKIYHNFTNVSGIFGFIFGIFAICLSVFTYGKVVISYTLMMGLFGFMFTFYPIISMKLNSRRQIKTVKAFATPLHYKVSEEKFILSQGEISEEITWDDIYKIRFTGKSLVLYITALKANIVPVKELGEDAVRFVEMAEKKLKPFQVKVNKNKLKKAI